MEGDVIFFFRSRDNGWIIIGEKKKSVYIML